MQTVAIVNVQCVRCSVYCTCRWNEIEDWECRQEVNSASWQLPHWLQWQSEALWSISIFILWFFALFCKLGFCFPSGLILGMETVKLRLLYSWSLLRRRKFDCLNCILAPDTIILSKEVLVLSKILVLFIVYLLQLSDQMWMNEWNDKPMKKFMRFNDYYVMFLYTTSASVIVQKLTAVMW